ncbi:MAG: DUF4097 family beta strand repeat-containing protein, partial [Acutalibacteraceae bacterium]
LLREKIAQLPQNDIDSFSQYVGEMIDDRIEDGLSEEEAVADIGSIDDIVKAILSDAGKENKSQKTAPSKKFGFFEKFYQRRGEIIQKKYDISGLFDDIFVSVINADIKVKASENGEYGVEFFGEEAEEPTVSVQNNTLSVINNEQIRFFNKFMCSDAVITITLPERKFSELSVSSKNGDISVLPGLEFERVKCENVSGNIKIESQVRKKCKLKTMSGKAMVKFSGCEEITAETVSGDITCSFLENSGSIDIKTVSGNIELTAVKAVSLQLRSTSGDISISKAELSSELYADSISGNISFKEIKADSINVKTTSGDISLIKSDASSLSFKSSSGDISGSLLSEKSFTAQSTSGDIRVPGSSGGGTCEARTISGDIKFTIV